MHKNAVCMMRKMEATRAQSGEPLSKQGVCGARARAWGPRQRDLGWAMGECQRRRGHTAAWGPNGTEADTAKHITLRQLPLGDRTKGYLHFFFKYFLHSLIFPDTLLLMRKNKPKHLSNKQTLPKHHWACTQRRVNFAINSEPSEVSP